MLLSRDAFREGVFARDSYKCVACGNPAQDAHHLLERRLWDDGGYYLDNGVSLCGECHIKAEMTLLTVDYLRRKAKIVRKVVPADLYHDTEYDKWGNVILPNGRGRTKGPLFHDESVQKVLRQGGVLEEFTDFVKYPRTHHLPWSPGMNEDDRLIPSLESLQAGDIVITEKMDGENTTMYRDGVHARSIDGRSHPSRDWVKNFWAKIRFRIPEGWRICGENLYAEHSIHYELPTYFMAFSIWDQRNVCLSWEDTKLYLKVLDIPVVPVLYEGPWNEDVFSNLGLDTEHQEGYVVRTTREFSYREFKDCVGKWVRKDHIQTRKHWFYGQSITPNTLIAGK